MDGNLAVLRGVLSSYSRASSSRSIINVTGGTWPKHKRGGHGSTATRVETMRERERREQLRRRVQKEARTSRDNSSEKNVVMVLSKLWRGLGREKRLAAQKLGGKADDVFGAFGYQEVELDSL